jgi:hypothetical protein
MDHAREPPQRFSNAVLPSRSIRDEVSLLCCSCLVEQTSSPAHVIHIASPVQLTTSPRQLTLLPRQHPSISITYAHAGSERRQPRPGPGRSKRERSRQRRTVETDGNSRDKGELSFQGETVETRRTVGTEENGRDKPQQRGSPVRPQ